MPPPAETYAQAVAAARAFHEEEVDLAQAEGKQQVTPFTPVSEALFEQMRNPALVEVARITYLSDGLRVKGFIWKPRNTEGRRLPVIIFNRGGNREFGKLQPWSTAPLMYALNGFVVVGSQYRGVDGGEGQEEFGGADVNDVLNLEPVIASLDYADSGNLFMLGWSRGGMMTYLALRRGTLAVRAAAVGGPLVNLVHEAERRPALVQRVWRQLIPGFADQPEVVLRERSPAFWAAEVETPMLIMHGGADWRADPANSLALAQTLQSAGRTYQLIIYAGDDHGITLHREDCVNAVVRWFQRHLTPAK